MDDLDISISAKPYPPLQAPNTDWSSDVHVLNIRGQDTSESFTDKSSLLLTTTAGHSTNFVPSSSAHFLSVLQNAAKQLKLRRSTSTPVIRSIPLLFNQPGIVNCPTGYGHAGISFHHRTIFHLALCPMTSKADTQPGVTFDCPAPCDAKGMTLKALALHRETSHARATYQTSVQRRDCCKKGFRDFALLFATHSGHFIDEVTLRKVISFNWSNLTYYRKPQPWNQTHTQETGHVLLCHIGLILKFLGQIPSARKILSWCMISHSYIPSNMIRCRR